jgi:hypothetical protein
MATSAYVCWHSSTREYRYEAIVRINAQSGKGGLAYVLETE